MDAEIKNFLIDQETPDMIDIYEESWNLLETLGHLDFADAFVELMMISDSSSIDSVTKHFRELLHDNLDMVIEEHGIFVNATANTLFKNNLLRFFIQIERTEFIDQCLMLLESDETNNTELFGEVMSIVVGGITTDDIISYLQPVSDSVINCLREYIRTRCELESQIDRVEDPELKEHYIALESYGRVMKAQSTVGYVLAFQPDGNVGGDFKDMINVHLKSMNRLDVTSFAKELVALALCCDCWKSPQIEIDNVMPMITENLKELADIQRAVGNELQLWKINEHKGS